MCEALYSEFYKRDVFLKSIVLLPAVLKLTFF